MNHDWARVSMVADAVANKILPIRPGDLVQIFLGDSTIESYKISCTILYASVPMVDNGEQIQDISFIVHELDDVSIYNTHLTWIEYGKSWTLERFE